MLESLNLEKLIQTLDYIAFGPFSLFFGALLGILIVFLAKGWSRMRGGPNVVVAIERSGGNVIVSRAAISELAQRVADTMDSVGKCVTRLNTHGGKLDIKVYCKLLAGTRLADVSEDLEKRVRYAMRENLALENLGKVEIEATGFVGKIQPNYVEESEEPEAPEEFEGVPDDEGEEVSEARY